MIYHEEDGLVLVHPDGGSVPGSNDKMLMFDQFHKYARRSSAPTILQTINHHTRAGWTPLLDEQAQEAEPRAKDHYQHDQAMGSEEGSPQAFDTNSFVTNPFEEADRGRLPLALRDLKARDAQQVVEAGPSRIDSCDPANRSVLEPPKADDAEGLPTPNTKRASLYHQTRAMRARIEDWLQTTPNPISRAEQRTKDSSSEEVPKLRGGAESLPDDTHDQEKSQDPPKRSWADTPIVTPGSSTSSESTVHASQSQDDQAAYLIQRLTALQLERGESDAQESGVVRTTEEKGENEVLQEGSHAQHQGTVHAYPYNYYFHPGGQHNGLYTQQGYLVHPPTQHFNAQYPPIQQTSAGNPQHNPPNTFSAPFVPPAHTPAHTTAYTPSQPIPQYAHPAAATTATHHAPPLCALPPPVGPLPCCQSTAWTVLQNLNLRLFPRGVLMTFKPQLAHSVGYDDFLCFQCREAGRMCDQSYGLPCVSCRGDGSTCIV
ncbi:hypothetical protein IQ07DRAFT_150431 [Pyrenochaeta sp. DS3sAY3a]|nr:hypothetical protein IQ07DRAFT_150431 [Pyrenochaeta sp. DS3sAY3a]